VELTDCNEIERYRALQNRVPARRVQVRFSSEEKVMEQQKYTRVPRHGLSNRYKVKTKAQRAAEVLTELHLRNGWKYVVAEFDSMPPTWVILKDNSSGEE
jgi:hypothetical protein